MSTAAAAREPFGARTMVWVVLAGVLAMAGFFLLTLYAPDFRIGGTGEPSPLSKSGVGFAGLVELLENEGVPTAMARSDEALATPHLLVVPLTEATDTKRLVRLIGQRRDLPTLFVLPKWQVLPMLGHDGWVQVIAPLPPAQIDRVLRAYADTSVGRGGTLRTLEIGGHRFAAPDQLQWVRDTPPIAVIAGEGRALVTKMQDQPHYILADPDLLDNAGLADPARAAAALALLRQIAPGAGPVTFDLTLAMAGGPSLGKLLVEPPFLPFTLTLVVAAGLALWQGFVRFGPPRAEGRAIAFGKAALVDTTAQLLRRGGRLGGLGGRYATLLQMRAGTLLGAPPGLSAEALDAWLDARDPGTPQAFTERAAAEAQATNEAEMQARGAALHRWIMERRREERV